MKKTVKTAMDMPQATLRLSEKSGTALALCAIKVTIGVLKKCRENAASNSQYEHFCEMIAEGKALSNALKSNDFTPISFNGDFTQCYWTAHETLLQIVEKSAKEFTDWKIHEIINEYDNYDIDDLTRICNAVFSAKMRHYSLDSRVKIRVYDSAKFKKVNLSGYQIASRKVRAYIENHVSPDTRRQKVVYLSQKVAVHDIDTDITYADTLYYEFPYGVIEKDNIFDNLVHTCDIEQLVKRMNLTEIQQKTLVRRLQGFGNKAIASETGKSKQAIADCLKAIRKKYYKTISSAMNADRFDKILNIMLDSLFDENTFNNSDFGEMYADTVKFSSKYDKVKKEWEFETIRKVNEKVANQNEPIEIDENAVSAIEMQFLLDADVSEIRELIAEYSK